MFVTEPEHELDMCSPLGDSSSRHWRVFKLTLQTIWFVLTVEVPDGKMTQTRTVGVAWDTDLVDLLDAMGPARVVSLLCMTPGWCSVNGQWTAHSVHEVWVASSADTDQIVILRDEEGHEFGDRRGARGRRSRREPGA